MRRSQMRKTNMYDYVIVGTGPAGSVIAKTLTDDLKTSVLVSESDRMGY
jgi:choline dehydrogenase